MRSATSGLFVVALAALTAVGFSSTAVSQVPQPAVTDDQIVIGVTNPITGPAAALGSIGKGLELRVNALNDAGGVKMGDGKTRKVRLILLDDAADPQRTLSNARRLIESDRALALAGTTTTAGNQAIASYVSDNKIPNVFLYSAIAEFGDEAKHPWSMGLVPSFPTEAAIYAEYLKTTRPKAKVALLYLNTDMGLGFQANFKQAIQGTSLELVAAQATSQNDPTVDTQMANLRASGADTLLIVTAPRQAAQGVKYAAESGWKPTTFVFAASSSVSNLKPAGLDNAKGVLTIQYLKQVDTASAGSDPAVQQYLAHHDKYRPRFEKPDTLGLHGYMAGDALIDVLQRMKEPTREALMSAARNMNGVSAGLLLPGITLSTKNGSDGYVLESLQMFQFDGERYQPVGQIISFEGKTKAN